MPQAELEPLKQELFSYLETLPEKDRTRIRTRTTLTEAGFGPHLNELYGGRWFRAIEDFQFYQFVKTAQSYLNTTSPEDKEILERRLLQYAFDSAGSSEHVLLVSIFGEQSQERYAPSLEAIRAYIKENPPVYNESYREGMLQILPSEMKVSTSRTIAGYQLLKEQVDEVLSTMGDRERRVLQLRFGLEDGRSRTIIEVGQNVPNLKTGQAGISEYTTRRIERTALRKLRHPSRRLKLRDFLE